ncbi:MAG TPA: hypothetical protein VD816_04815 [Ohtaekwangia sp.]|nr:hypothetical protein [Ohtaekwangia sp.]
MMTKLLKLILPALLGVTAIGCEKADDLCCFVERKAGESLEGSWLLYERGYSPGAGYIIEPVPADPAKILTFGSNGELSANLESIKQFKYYRILDDPYAQEQKILALYTDDPGDEPQDISQLQHSYSITRTDNNLKLSFRYCIEGCHMSFRPIALEQ